MKKYKRSLLYLGIGFASMAVGVIWEDLSFIGFVGLIFGVSLAIQSAFDTSNTFSARVKLLSLLSAIVLLLAGLGLTIFNPPQCPEDYSPKNGFDCIIGANIGLPLYFAFIVFPLTIVVAALWIKTLLDHKQKPKKPSNPQPQKN